METAPDTIQLRPRRNNNGNKNASAGPKKEKSSDKLDKDAKDTGEHVVQMRRPGLVRSTSVNAIIRQQVIEGDTIHRIANSNDSIDTSSLLESALKDSKDSIDNDADESSFGYGSLFGDQGFVNSLITAPTALFSLPFAIKSSMESVVTGIIGTVDSIGDSVPLNSNIISRKPDDMSLESWLSTDVGKALQNMSSSPHIFKHIRVLFVQLYDSLDNIKVNVMQNSVNQFKSRLSEFVLALGSPTDSVLLRLQTTPDAPLPPSPMIREIEDALSRAWIYFSRFNKSNALLHLLVSSDLPSFMFAYDNALTTGCNHLIENTKKYAPVAILWNLSVGPTPIYKPHCNLLQYLSDSQLNTQTNEAPLSEESIAALQSYVDMIRMDSDQLVETQIHMIIRQRRLREVWVLAATISRTPEEEAEHCMPEAVTFEAFEAALIQLVKRDAAQGDRSAFATPRVFLTKQPPPGPSLEKSLQLAHDMLFNLQAILTLNSEGKLTPKSIAMVSKCIAYDENRLHVVMETLLKLGKARCVRIVPPPKLSYESKNLFWENDLYRIMARAFQVPGVINNVYGLHGCGKTTRVLAVAHAMSPQIDVLYVDFTDATSLSSMKARMANQLYFPYSIYEDIFVEALDNRLKTLRRDAYGNCPLIIFDGIDNHLPKAAAKKKQQSGNAQYIEALAKIVSLFATHLPTLSLAIVSTHSLHSNDCGLANINPIHVKELSINAARGLAHVVYPAASADLIRAGRSLAGSMVTLADQHSFMAIRSVAKMMKSEVHYDHKSYNNILCEDIALSLTRDETLCGTLLWRGMSAFDEAMGWILCRRAFNDDIVRWRIAWIGLVDAGWMNYDPDIGFTVSSFAMVMDIDESERKLINVEAQWRNYILHWAGQCIRIHNNYGLEISYFMQYKAHFITLFGTFFPTDQYYIQEGSKNSLIYPDQAGLALLLAGHVSKIAQLALEPQLAAELVRKLEGLIPDQESIEYILALTDVAIEDIRTGRHKSSFTRLQAVVSKHDRAHLTKHPAVAHAWAVLGYLSLIDEEATAARQSFHNALEIWGEVHRRSNIRRLTSTNDIVMEIVKSAVDYFTIDEAEWESTKKRMAQVVHLTLKEKEKLGKSYAHIDDVGPLGQKSNSCCIVM